MRQLILATVLVLTTTMPAAAKPIFTKFEDAIRKSSVIVVARFDGARPGQGGAAKNCVLEFTRVLKGEVTPGNHVVTWRDSYVPSLGNRVTEFIAFLDDELVWHYAAVPATGYGEVADQPLHMVGFYNFNAHFISVSLLSLPLLESYLKTGKMTYSFRGPLWFPVPGQAKWEASRIVLEGSHDPFGNQSSLRRLPPLVGLTDGKVSLGSWHIREGIEIAYSRNRPLEIHGKVESLDAKTGTFVTRFNVVRPDVLSQKEFEAYVANADRGDSHYRVKLRCPAVGKEPEKTLVMRLGERGRTGSVTGWGEREVRFDSSSSSDLMFEARGDLDAERELVVRLDIRKAPRGDGIITWSFQNSLLYDLNVMELEGVVEVRNKLTQDVLQTRPLTASLEGVYYETLKKK